MPARKPSKTSHKQIKNKMAEEREVAQNSEQSVSPNPAPLSPQQRLAEYRRTRPTQILVQRAKTMEEVTVGLLFPNRDTGNVVTE
jgi:rRNA maturation protein Nop10